MAHIFYAWELGANLGHIGAFLPIARQLRERQLYAKDKAIGAPLISIQAIQDLPQAVKDRLYFVRFEDLTAEPAKTMAAIYAWLGLAPRAVDLTKLTVRPHESDSHYRFKYRHKQRANFAPPKPHAIPPRIQKRIQEAYGWFYEWFYPGYLKAPAQRKARPPAA